MNTAYFRTLGSEKVARIVLVCGTVALLLFALLPSDSAGRAVVSAGAIWVAAIFAVVALVGTFGKTDGAGKLFWGLLGIGLLMRFPGPIAWSLCRLFGWDPSIPAISISQTLAYSASYLFLFGALLWLVTTIRKRIVSTAVLDVLGVALTSGLLIWYFLLSPEYSVAAIENFVALLQPVLDLGLFMLCLSVLVTPRGAPSLKLLVGGFLLFLVADGVYLQLRSTGWYELGNWPGMLQAGGVVFLGLTALHWEPEALTLRPRVSNLGTLLFWLGPFSPLLQYGFLLAWCAYSPPVPGYVLVAGTGLAVILTVRTLLATRVNEALSREQEAAAKRLEQGRIVRELHDTVKQNVHGTRMMIEACTKACNSNKPEAVWTLLEQALDTCREADHQLSKPIDELRIFTTENSLTPTAYFTERLEKFGQYFDVQTHVDLQAPLESLTNAEISVANRVFIEATWNVAKHSGARNLWLESRRSGPVYTIRIRDDGCGFSSEDIADGMGLGFMGSRAGEIGAELEIASEPGEGTIVELRFGKK